MRAELKALAGAVIVLCAIVGSAPQTRAQSDLSIAQAPPAAPQAPPELDSADLSAWLDGFLPHAMAEAGIVGGVVTVVRDGQVIANRGYGYSDLVARTPVDPGTTLFRPGSISKLFTWTAVMQLVERGEIDLDADVNTYLDFEIPPFEGEPITMRQIMTHTTGFEEVMRDLTPFDASATPISLERYLKSNLPRRLYPPGTMPAYSNYATALAGYVVERVSGEGFDAYVERHIFEPLGMHDSTFAQPLPGPMAERLSRGYASAAQGAAQPFEVIIASPAGALTSTAPDMARFMIAHLNDGAGLMRPETARLMHNTIDRQFPGVNAMALGFYQEDYAGQRIVSHGGDTAWFHSNLSLLLDQNVGVYVSFNSSGRTPLSAALLRMDILRRFVDRYYPSEQSDPAPLSSAREHGAALVGDFERARRSETNPIYAAYFLGQISVIMLENGDLVGPGLPRSDGQPMRWREVEPWVWQAVGSHERMGARVDADGQVNALAFEPFAFAIPFTRAPWWRSKSILAPLLFGALGAMTLLLASWPVRAMMRRAYKTAFPYAGLRAHAHRIAPAAAALGLTYIVVWALFLGWILSALPHASSEGPASAFLSLAYASNALLALGAGAAVFVNVALWRAPASVFAKATGAFLLLAFLALAWFAAAMNFFSFSFQY